MDTLRSLGYRLTPQRRLVLQILQESQEHLEAEVLYDRAKARDPRISLATVYRTLSVLKEAGLIQEHKLGEDHGHFEAAPEAPHYHFTCTRCGRVLEFDAPQVMEVVRRLCQRKNLLVDQVHLHLSGICAECRDEGRDRV